MVVTHNHALSYISGTCMLLLVIVYVSVHASSANTSIAISSVRNIFCDFASRCLSSPAYH